MVGDIFSQVWVMLCDGPAAGRWRGRQPATELGRACPLTDARHKLMHPCHLSSNTPNLRSSSCSSAAFTRHPPATLLERVVKPQPVITPWRHIISDVDAPIAPAPYFDPPLERVSYGTKPGALVFGWPAKGGGVYILTAASAVEIEFLGYDRFKQCRAPLIRLIPTPPQTKRRTAIRVITLNLDDYLYSTNVII